MEKLYYKNQYLKEFDAKVIEVNKVDDIYHIVLDKTAFFPGGGGQQSDLGYINGNEVLEVYEKDKSIYHVVKASFEVGDIVSCIIDWDRRQDGMHQHLGQHVLSGCFFKLFNANTVSIHLGKEISTVDIIGILNEEQVREAEAFANEIINNGIEVSFLIPNEEELKTMNLRRDLPNTQEEIRVVKIGDLDINACCGVHPSKTSDLKMIKIKRFEKNKGNTRIEFLAGQRAINDSLIRDKALRDICIYLNSNEEEALNGIKNLKNSLEEIKGEKKRLEEELLKYEEESLLREGNILEKYTVVKKVFIDKSTDYVTRLANKLTEVDNTICLFAIKSKEKANIIIAASKNIENINMGQLFREHIHIVNGKGGGSKTLAQGVGEVDKIEEFFNSIYKKID
ncbi:DHHA1 domain-containing protein [Clostridium sp. AL.422]|uniref:alanyl-tRNA editing protein n=1 Tax=Clostridium TaxID=1485 RepID=UPI00293DAA0C|nr:MULTISPECIES: DHHA1 domain-containing protein [unclassified Clostridium]MDV4149860.1 DHHA1 domain-containing protein [Clostridium sp. AL.422]